MSQNALIRKTWSLESPISGLRSEKLPSITNVAIDAVRVWNPAARHRAAPIDKSHRGATCHQSPATLSSVKFPGKKSIWLDRGKIPSSVKNAVTFGKSCRNQLIGRGAKTGRNIAPGGRSISQNQKEFSALDLRSTRVTSHLLLGAWAA